MIPVDVFALLFVSAPPTAVQPPTVTISPPTSPTTRRVGGIPGSVAVSWTVGDSTAYTRIYVDTDSGFYPYATVNPAVTQWVSDIPASQSYTFTLTHFKDGLESTSVSASWTANSP